jgi:hypothetical protein
MKQKSLASKGFELVTKRTRKREFLAEMNSVVRAVMAQVPHSLHVETRARIHLPW